MIIQTRENSIDYQRKITNLVNDLTSYYSRWRQFNSDPVKIGSIISKLMTNNALKPDSFPKVQNTYSRTILVSIENHLEIMIARWDKDTLTSIHGHPGFVFEYLIEGQFIIENYKRKDNSLKQISTIIQKPGDYFCDLGNDGRFDNAIHRIHAVKPSLSLHIYSDQGLKGLVFQDPASDLKEEKK